MKKLLLSLTAFALLTTGFACAQNTAHETVQKIISQKEILKGIPMTTVDPFAVVLQFGDSFAAGIYDQQSKRIFIAENQPFFALKHIALHEAGHFIFNRTPESMQWQYCRAFVTDGLSASRYGLSSCGENFAELFAFMNGSRWGMFSGLDFYFEGSAQLRMAESIIEEWTANKRTK